MNALNPLTLALIALAVYLALLSQFGFSSATLFATALVVWYTAPENNED